MKLLLHCCCGPCSAGCVDMLRQEGIEPVGYWNNPNIHPFTEYRARREGMRAFAAGAKMALVEEGAYGLRPFLAAVGGDFDGRCRVCYALRFEAAARYAKENGFDAFTSTLLVSPYQNNELMREVAEKMGERFGIAFLNRDFRPRFREGQQMAREMGLYMQKYCGCVFSEEDRYAKKR